MQFELLEDRLALAVFTVTSLADGPVNLTDAVVTLRDALHAADNNLQVAPGGPTGGVTDEVIFQPGLAGVMITLTQGQLAIRSDVTLTGPGANLLRISGNNANRIFDVNDQSPDVSSVRTVAISGLTLFRGNVQTYHGGAILNGEALTITGCTIRDNTTVTSGGGVFNIGAGSTLTVRDSTLSGNFAYGDGGGIASHGALTVQNSTISGNGAYGSGGGIAGFGNTLTVQNSTLTGNRANVFSYPGEGGGIWFVDTTVLLHNTIIAGNFKFNTNLTASDIVAHNGGVSAESSNNLVGTGGSGGLTNGANGNQVDVANPGLLPLANNGGPTMTHALLAGSPAIDAGNPAYLPPPDFDQRGAPFARVALGRIDIGAYEVQAPSADFDGDYDVDGFDFLAWQRGLGTTVGATRAQGNADGDGDVDGADLAVWKSIFGYAPPPPGNGLLGAYFNNVDLTAPVFERTDPTVNFSWGSGSPGMAISADTFSVRWTGQVEARFTETFTFRTTSDDGVRLWINNQLIIDQWNDHPTTDAVARLAWSSPSQPFQIIPQSQLYSDPPAEPALAAGALASFSDLGSAPPRPASVAETPIPVAEKPHNSAADAVFAAGDFTRLFATSGVDDHDARRSYRPRRRR